MATSKNKSEIPHLVNEGTPLSVVARKLEEVEGTTKVEANIEFRSAPAPTRRFIADCFEVRAQFNECRLIFGQRKVDGHSIRALLDIRFAREPLAGALSSLKTQVRKDSIDKDEYRFAFVDEPEQTIAVEANFLRASIGPSAATIDFYYASGFSVSHMMANQVLYVDEVVRILVPHKLCFEMYSDLVALAQ